MPETNKADGAGRSDPTHTSDYFKEFGALVEALELARACIQRGSGQTLTLKLQEIGASKDYYYRRAEEFKKITGLDLTEQIEAQVAANDRKERNPRGDLFSLYETARERYELIVRGEGARHPVVRAGVSEILARPLVGHAVRQFRRQPGCKESAIGLDLDLKISGQLHRMFDESRLDLYVSQLPGDRAKKLGVTPFTFPFWFACPYEHPAAELHRKLKTGKKVPLTELNDTTLYLLGPHPDRLPQYAFPRERIRDGAPGVRIIEVDTFTRVHYMLASGEKNVAAFAVPEFLEEESLRGLTFIPAADFDGTLEIEPVRIYVVRRTENLDDATRAAVATLAGEFESGMRAMANDELVQTAATWLRTDAEQHIYYERTKEADPDHPAPRAWAHSVIQWRVLKNGCVVGRHTVDARRGPDGEFRDTGQIFDLLGRLVRNPHNKDEYHLIWSGVEEGSQETYTASFVVPAETFRAGRASDRTAVDPTRDIVGTWAGRRTSSISAFQPSAGVMVISLQPPGWHIGSDKDKDTGKAVPEAKQEAVLAHLIACAKGHAERFPGIIRGEPATAWEWQQSPRSATSDPVTRLADLLARLQPGLRQFEELQPLIKELTAAKRPPDLPAKPHRRGTKHGA